MKAVVILGALLFVSAVAQAVEIDLPADLSDYERQCEKQILERAVPTGKKDTICVTVAYGDDATVKYQEEMRIPKGWSAAQAARKARAGKHGMLIGWAQGLVIVRHKDGGSAARIAWSQREAREKAQDYILDDGDVLIGLCYGDF